MPYSCFFCPAKSGLHKLPEKAELRAKWLAVMPIPKESNKINASFRICSAHFNENSLTWRGRLILNAVPSKFPNTDDDDIGNLDDSDPLNITKTTVLNYSNAVISQPSTSFHINDESKHSTLIRTSPSPVFRYVGDIDDTADYPPRTFKRALRKCNEKIRNDRKKICHLQRKVRRMKAKIDPLDSFSKDLKNRGNISGDSLDPLNHSTMNKPKHILELSREEKKKFIDSFDLVLSDCDGVLWRSKSPIENAGAGINVLQAANKKIGYISNNSGRSDEEYAELFKSCNIKCDLDDLCHTTKNIVSYLRSIKFEGNIYAIGSDSLHKQLSTAGYKLVDEPNYATEESFLGFLQYISVQEKVSAVILHGYWNVTAVNLIRAQVYLAKNPECILITGASDMFLKFQDNSILGPGQFTKILSDSLNRKPIVLSKPGADLGDIILKKFEIKQPERVIMIGDMLEQDIGFGKLCGFQTMAVLTGGATLEDFSMPKYSDILPDFYANSLAEFVTFFNDLDNNKIKE